jgi:hypothetical protein
MGWVKSWDCLIRSWQNDTYAVYSISNFFFFCVVLRLGGGFNRETAQMIQTIPLVETWNFPRFATPIIVSEYRAEAEVSRSQRDGGAPASVHVLSSIVSSLPSTSTSTSTPTLVIYPAARRLMYVLQECLALDVALLSPAQHQSHERMIDTRECWGNEWMGFSCLYNWAFSRTASSTLYVCIVDGRPNLQAIYLFLISHFAN